MVCIPAWLGPLGPLGAFVARLADLSRTKHSQSEASLRGDLTPSGHQMCGWQRAFGTCHSPCLRTRRRLFTSDGSREFCLPWRSVTANSCPGSRGAHGARVCHGHQVPSLSTDGSCRSFPLRPGLRHSPLALGQVRGRLLTATWVPTSPLASCTTLWRQSLGGTVAGRCGDAVFQPPGWWGWKRRCSDAHY